MVSAMGMQWRKSKDRAPAVTPVDNGVVAMSRLADRLASVAQPMAVTGPSGARPRFSPAVTAALSRNAAAMADARRRAQRSLLTLAVESFVSACSFIHYAVVALALRVVMARLFFLDGQALVTGPIIEFDKIDFPVVLPAHVKAETFAAFLSQYPGLPVSSNLVAYFVSYAEFALPICLLVGFGTRIAAFGLLLISLMIQFYAVPFAPWS